MRPLETSSTSSIVVRYSHCPFRQTSVLQFVGTKSDSNRIETEGGGDLNWPGEEEKRNHAPPYPRLEMGVTPEPERSAPNPPRL